MLLDGIDFSKHVLILDSNMFITDYMRNYLKNNLVKSIEEYRAKHNRDYVVNIPRTVLEELEYLKTKPGAENIGVRTEAFRGLEAAKDLIRKGYARPIKSDYTDSANGFNDVAVLTMLMELRRHFNVAVLSNDRAFARDLIVLNNLQSVKSKKKIKVYFIGNKDSKVKEWLYDAEVDKAVRFPKEIKK